VTPFLQECSAQFSNSMEFLTVLVIGSVALLTRRSRSARSGAAVLLGLLMFLVPWLLVSCALVSYFYWPLSTRTPHDDGIDADLAMHIWGLAYAVAETVVVVLMARVLRNAARDPQPVGCAGPLAPGHTPERTLSQDMPPQDGTGFAEQDPERRLGGFTGKGEHSVQQPTPRHDGDATAKSPRPAC